MRIIRGTLKGRRITPPKALPVRPTTDFAKEGLFNIIENNFDIEELKILDLFAGTGSISYEFASRGAKQITTIDSNIRCIRFIKATTEHLNIENIIGLKADVFRFLSKSIQTFDIIFADPPYDIGQDKYLEILNLVMEKQLLQTNGWLIIEHSKKIHFPTLQMPYEHRKYGNVNFSIYKNIEG